MFFLGHSCFPAQLIELIAQTITQFSSYRVLLRVRVLWRATNTSTSIGSSELELIYCCCCMYSTISNSKLLFFIRHFNYPAQRTKAHRSVWRVAFCANRGHSHRWVPSSPPGTSVFVCPTVQLTYSYTLIIKWGPLQELTVVYEYYTRKVFFCLRRTKSTW